MMSVGNPECNLETCWTVAEGTLDNTITFHSSTPDASSSSSSRTPHPLLLTPNASDLPCEIKITFAQEHLIRKVYICSSARVCEVYHAPDSRSSNQYLCTIRGGPVLNNNGSVETGGNGVEDREPMGDISKRPSGNNSSNSEDEWIEVKRVASEPGSIQSILNTFTGTSEQACFGAAIEMSDPVSCVSLTLRLLSLQRREYAVLMEVHVSADPVPTAGSSPDDTRFSKSSTTSAMAMLLPTLLHLSGRGSPGFRATDPPPRSTPTIPAAEDPVPDGARHDSRADVDCILSRMSRLEDVMLRLEQSVVDPIARIERQLDRLEQQLNHPNEAAESVDRLCLRRSRFSAPEFTCGEPDFHTPGGGARSAGEDGPGSSPGSDEPPGEVFGGPAPASACPGPGLRVIAPDFCSGGEAEEEPKPKRVGVGEIMAAELAAFVASATANFLKYPPGSEEEAGPEESGSGLERMARIPLRFLGSPTGSGSSGSEGGGGPEPALYEDNLVILCGNHVGVESESESILGKWVG